MRLPALLLCLAATASADPYLDAARDIGDFLVQSARHDGDGIYWAQYEGGPPTLKDEDRQFPVSVYSGAAGTGLFLLNLHRMTAERKYLDAARAVGLRLEKIAQKMPTGAVKWEGTSERKGKSIPEGYGPGLYTGSAGIGLFLMHLHDATKDDRFRALAIAGFARVLEEAQAEAGGHHWVYSFQDIIGGEAGIGLALLEMHRMTKDARYLEAARKAAAWLLAKATREKKAMFWTTYGSKDAGFSHGVSGIAFFLMAMPDKEYREAGRLAARWVESAAAPAGKDGVLWKYYVGDPPEGKPNWVMNSWCHGAPGVVRLFVLEHRRAGDAAALATAVKGGGGIASECRLGEEKPSFYNPTLCCGGIGCADAFVDLHRASGKAEFLDHARKLADAVIASLRTEKGFRAYASYDEADEAEKKHPYYETGLMLGNAGIGQALLRLSAEMSGKRDRVILLPDQPFAVPTEK